MVRGRKPSSVVRQRMIGIIACLGAASGYDLYKVYVELFPKCTLRLIYYHLKKGVQYGQLVVHAVQKTEGTYSWGSTSEKTLYRLGPNAEPHPDARIRDYVAALKKEEKEKKQRKQ